MIKMLSNTPQLLRYPSSSKIDAILLYSRLQNSITACSKEMFVAAALKYSLSIYSLNELLIYIE